MTQVRQIYVTRSNDLLDVICKRVYGAESPATELVLEANPGLADAPLPLPTGLRIILPAIEVTQTAELVRLWN